VQIRMADGVRLVRAELRADSVENEDAIRQIEGVLDSSNAEEFPPWSETSAPYTLPLAGAGGTLAAAWLPATVALRSGTPATGRVASWASSTSVGDAGFAVSDVARRNSLNTFSSAQTFSGGIVTEAVQSPTLLNGWVNFGSGYATVGYWKDPQGMVWIQGVVKDGAIPADIFVLPVGYRPAARHIFVVNTNGLFGRVDVLASGAVRSIFSSNLLLSFGTLAFRAA
jgi:hypothetical protein